MTKMVGKMRGWGVNFWASENWSGRVDFWGHSPEWRVLSKLSVQPCINLQVSPVKDQTLLLVWLCHLLEMYRMIFLK